MTGQHQTRSQRYCSADVVCAWLRWRLQPRNCRAASPVLFATSPGMPQMGATVLLFNRSERADPARPHQRARHVRLRLACGRILIRFAFRWPASCRPLKQKIAVQPGMQSLLYVNLASVLSSIELVYATPGQGALMSDDWKWTLKGIGSHAAGSAGASRWQQFGSARASGFRQRVFGNARSAECFGWRSGIFGKHVIAGGLRHGVRAGNFVSRAQSAAGERQCRLQPRAPPCRRPASAPATAAMA